MTLAEQPERFLRLARLGLLLACAAAAGCGAADRSCPVSGSVKIDGRQAGGVYVVFHAAGDETPPEGTSSTRTDERGNFRWTVPRPGKYAVTAFWPKLTVTEDETLEGPDRFHGKYRDVENPAATVVIEASQDQPLLIELSTR